MNPQIQPHSTHDTLTSACRVRPLGEEDVKQRVARSADFSVAIHQAEIAHVKQSRQAKLSFYVSEDEQYGDDKEEVVRGLYGMDGVDFKTTMDQLCELTAKGRDIHNSLYAVIEMPSNTPVLSHDASHGQLVQFYDLESTAEDERLTGEIIYGFITASGHFLNRLEAAKWLQNKFPELIKKPIEYERLISSNVDWVKVIKRSSYLLGR